MVLFSNGVRTKGCGDAPSGERSASSTAPSPSLRPPVPVRRAGLDGQVLPFGDDEFDECWILDVFAPPREDLK